MICVYQSLEDLLCESMACHEQPPEQLYNQYYNLTEWKIRNFCGKYKIEYGTDIGLQNVRRAPPWKVQVCGSSPSASPGSPTFSRRCLIIAKLLQLPIVSNTCNTYCLLSEREVSSDSRHKRKKSTDLRVLCIRVKPGVGEMTKLWK